MAQQDGRVAPPQGLRCDRNQLTSYNGVLSRYKPGEAVTVLEIETEWGTRELVKLNSGRKEVAANFLLNGRPFEDEDWNVISNNPGLRTPAIGTQVIVWVCLDDKTPPIVDWRPTQGS